MNNEIANFASEIGFTTTSKTYSALEIAGTHENGSRWRLQFQEIPKKDIILTGEPPNRNQILGAISSSMMPAIFVPLIEIIIDYVLTHPKSKHRSYYEIWSEGYIAQGWTGSAVYQGSYEADTFKSAVDQWVATLEEKSRAFVDIDRMTYWGCKLFDNEEDARRRYG